MKFNVSMSSFNLILTGVMSVSGGLGLGLGDVLDAFTPPKNDAATSVQELVFVQHSPVITADSTIQINFDKSVVVTTAKPVPVLAIGVASADPEAQSSTNFDVQAAIKAATAELGKSFSTGWNKPGECLVAAKRWITAGKGSWSGGGTPIGNYGNAKEVEYKNAAPGDVIQYLYTSNPESWVKGVHTILVTANNGDGTLQIIEANNPGGSGLVSENKSWTPAPPKGFEYKVFRF